MAKTTALILVTVLSLAMFGATVTKQDNSFTLITKTVEIDDAEIAVICLRSPIETTLQAYDIYYQADGVKDHIQAVADPDKYMDFAEGDEKIIAVVLYYDTFILCEESNIAISKTPESPKLAIIN